VELLPDSFEAHYGLAMAHLRDRNVEDGRRELERAVRELEVAVQHQADLAQGYYQLSRAYSMLGDKEKSAAALAAFDKLKKQEADDNQELMDSLRQEVEAP
jgi:predicted Zn-dependent protease